MERPPSPFLACAVDSERTTRNGVNQYVHYISGGDGLCAIAVKEGNSAFNFYVPYTDHLGSIVTVTNTSGNIVAEQNWDAWGRKRNATTWDYANVAANPTWLYRGYTGHEHLSEFNLINMNARLYDPVLGRMLSPDNYVSVSGSQGMNRYTYANNNPLKYADPSGNNPILAGALIGAVTGVLFDVAVQMIENKSFDLSKIKATRAMWAGASGAISGATGAWLGKAGYFAYSSISNNIARSTLQGATTGAISGAVAGGIVGGIQGNFARGALTGAASGAVSGAITGALFPTKPHKAGTPTDNNSPNARPGHVEVTDLKAEMIDPYTFEPYEINWHTRNLSEGVEFDIQSDKLVKVRHHTSPANLKLIRSDGKINASWAQTIGLQGVDVEISLDGTFAPYSKAPHFGNGGKGSYIEFQIPRSMLRSVPTGYAGHEGNAFVGRIITGGQPLSLNDLNPLYIRWWWMSR